MAFDLQPTLRGALLELAILLVLLGVGCRKSAPMGSEIANQRLHDHILKNHKKVYSESLGSDVLWSDGAIIERARELPGPVKALIDTPTGPADAAIGPDALVQFLQDVDRRKAEWGPATLRRKGTADLDCEVGDGTTSAVVNCIYANYIEARYPGGKFLVKGKLEAVLVVEGDQIRVGLMPVKL